MARLSVLLLLVVANTWAQDVTTEIPPNTANTQDDIELVTLTSASSGQIVEVSEPVAALLRNPNNVAVPETIRVPFNHIPAVPTKKPAATSTTTPPPTTRAPTSTTPTTSTATPPTTTITPSTTVRARLPGNDVQTTPAKQREEEVEPPSHLVPRKVPSRGPYMHSCPRPEDIHPCECLEISNHYNKSEVETVSFCKNIRNSEVLKVAMSGMKGHFINYFVLDSCKLPPFPNGLFHNIGIGWMEALNSTVQFQESFFTCSNGCW